MKKRYLYIIIVLLLSIIFISCSNKKDNDDKINVLEMAERVEKKLNSLNEAEQSLVKDIMMANSSLAEQRRENIFKNLENSRLSGLPHL